MVRTKFSFWININQIAETPRRPDPVPNLLSWSAVTRTPRSSPRPEHAVVIWLHRHNLLVYQQ
jgi:hypothetical protein